MVKVRQGFAVLGLDALPHWMLPRLAEEGLAPRIFNDKMLSRSRRLECIPPITPASWPSIMSGVNPGKHGIYSFFRFDRATRGKRLYTALDLQHPRIHEILSYNAVPSIVVNPIPGHPIIRVSKSIIVSNSFFIPHPDSHPRGIIEKYYSDSWPQESVEDFIDYTEKTIAFLEDHFTDPPPLTWVNLEAPDALFHKNPGLLDKPGSIGKLWHAIDRLARLMKDTYGNLVVVSDHGFRTYEARVSVNDILYRHGLAVPGEKDTETLKEAKARQRGEETVKLVLPAWIYRVVSRLGLEKPARTLYRATAGLYQRLTGKRIILQAGRPLDLQRSKAFLPFGGAYGVYVLEGDPQEVYEILQGYDGLLVWPRDQVYTGPYTGDAPDIVVVGDHEKGYILGNEKIVGDVYVRGRTYGHDLWGALLMDLEQDLDWEQLPQTIPNHTVANLIMCLMNIPLSARADGLDIIEKTCGKPRLRDYTGRFLLSKKLTARRHRAAAK